MRSWLKRLYHKLPLVREQHMILDELARQRMLGDVALRTQIEQHIAGLLRHPKYADSKRLASTEAQLFSQNGEDGIIGEIFRRIGSGSKTFVEIGVGDGLQNNTALLLSQNWSGWWVEADPGNLAAIRENFKNHLSRKTLSLIPAFVNAANMVSLLMEAGVPSELDFLSLDIDLNTYYVWEALLPHVRARVFAIEYNGHIPAGVDWKVDYAPDSVWDQSGHWWGASLKAMTHLAERHGYQLVGCDLNGVNAFFVRADLCGDLFPTPATAEHLYEPARDFLLSWRNLLPQNHHAALQKLLIREAGR
ncbi:hypothetical protein [Zavarzinella formosa]|uniref:hypothetical protein n=1 Tax=Zavarzinella formosa TaxID=360055 RepID=UPI0002E77FA2|nr:hypothetical protein [Zavarzinella formosa]